MKGKEREDRVVALVQETRNFNKFVLAPLNRKISRHNIEMIKESMKEKGFRNANAVDVIRINGKLVLQGGHHRFMASQELGIPLKYILSEDQITPHELEDATKMWDLGDYLHSWVQEKKSEYKRVEEFHERTGIALSMCLAILRGHGAEGRRRASVQTFKEGRYRITDVVFAERVADLVQAARDGGFKHAGNWMFVDALVKLVKLNPLFIDLKRLKRQLKKYGKKLNRQGTVKDYIQDISDWYNRGTSDKLSLVLAYKEDRMMAGRR